MSTYEKECLATYVAGEELNGKLHEILTLNSSGRVVVSKSQADLIIGILAVDPPTGSTGQPVSVAKLNGSDKLLVKASTAITVGQILVPAATDGKVAGVANLGAVPAGTSMAIGVALQAAAADDDVIQFSVQPLANPA